MKLLIVDDHEVVRKGLVNLLALRDTFSEISEAGNIQEAMKTLRVLNPDMAIIDICLGRKENGLEIIERCQEEHLKTKFLVLTSSYRKDDFRRAKELEVNGYVLKDSNLEDIDYAIRSVMKGRYFYDSSLQKQDSKDIHQEVRELLTEREYEVLRALGKGLTNQQIAENLFITENTVKKHISSLLGKLQLAHRTEAAIYASKLWRRAEDEVV